MPSVGEVDLMVNSSVVGTASVTGLGPLSALYPRLAVDLDIRLTDHPREVSAFNPAPIFDFELRDLTGELRLKENTDTIGTVMLVGQRRLMKSGPTGNRHTLRLACDLTAARLEKIETYRAGGVLSIWLELWPVLFRGTQQLDAKANVFRLEIPQHTWTQTLERLGYGTYEIIEVRYDPSDALRFKRALEHRFEARAAIVGGHYDQAIGKGRLAIDAMFNALVEASKDGSDGGQNSGEGQEQGKTVKASFRELIAPRTDLDRADAYAKVLSGLKDLTHLPHKTSTGPRVYQRAEAEFVVRGIENALALVGALTSPTPT